jgi:hypothetical protein
MDTRLLVIALPLLVAASWALFNIGRLAIQQIQKKMDNSQSYLTFSII